jgi:hypothetical protein
MDDCWNLFGYDEGFAKLLIYTVNHLKKIGVDSEISFDGMDVGADVKPDFLKIKYFKTVLAPVWIDELIISFMLKEHIKDKEFKPEFEKARIRLSNRVYFKKGMYPEMFIFLRKMSNLIALNSVAKKSGEDADFAYRFDFEKVYE